MFSAGDKVIKRTEKDPGNWGQVLDIPATSRKPGHIAVYFQRQVWIKPENLMLFDEWKAKQKKAVTSIKNYWLQG